VLLGKLATHELAYGVTTSNPKSYGTTVNPWDYQRIPGGSSGGSGAAIAARLAAATIGTDTGGSIRIPASFCGCVGFKPTYGVVSRTGIAPLSWFLDHAGPITATVRDAALVLDAISGYDPDDEATLPGAGGVVGVADQLDGDVTGLRVGIPRTDAWAALEPGVRSAAEAALIQLESLGMHLIEVDVPSQQALVEPIFAVVSAESRAAHSSIWPERHDDFGPDLQRLLAIPALDGDATIAVLRAVAGYRQAMRRVFAEVDLLVSPTTPIVAPAHQAETVELAGSQVPVIMAAVVNTMPYNLAHLPAVSVPCGSADGLPVGLQLAGGPFDDARVLRAAHAYEQSTHWHERRP
jgi:Asp-tRNA(Asn)/Glu-tRNA(Gln) amidotransferase A subunit family amidase